MQVMDNVIEQVRAFINQEIELYGDDYIVSNDLIRKKPVQPASSNSTSVFYEGDFNADVAVILENSTVSNTVSQSFFAGEHGELLTKILGSIEFTRKNVFFAVLVKSESEPGFSETDYNKTVLQSLEVQLNDVNPAFILCFGKRAGQILCKTHDDVDKLRGKTHNFGNAAVIVTHHPDVLAKNDKLKRETWDDMKLLQRLYNSWKQQNRI